MKIIDDAILKGLAKMRKAYSTNREMAAALGLSPGQVSNLLRRKVSHFSTGTWERIKPRVMPFVEEELKRTTCKGCPKVEVCLFKLIVKNLLEVPTGRQADIYEEVNEFVLKSLQRVKHEKQEIHS